MTLCKICNEGNVEENPMVPKKEGYCEICQIEFEYAIWKKDQYD